MNNQKPLNPNVAQIRDDSFIDEMDSYLLQSKPIKDSIPCNKCNGDCCGPVPFKINDLKAIFIDKDNVNDPEFKKRFRFNIKSFNKNINFVNTFPGVATVGVPYFKNKSLYERNSLNGTLDCIFKKSNKTGGCLIYNNPLKPKVCDAYGMVEALRCPYTGLDEQPTNEQEKNQLIAFGHVHRNNDLMQNVSKINNTLK